MDELVKLVSKKTGLSEELSQQAIDVVIDYLKDKLPAPIASRIDSLIEGGGDMDDIAGALGGLFGK